MTELAGLGEKTSLGTLIAANKMHTPFSLSEHPYL